MEYVKERLNADFVIAAGDSLLDMDLLERADRGILAAHGEAAKNNAISSDHIRITKQTGIKAGEEILAHVTEMALQHR